MAGMRLAGDALWQRLRELDDPDHLERPADFDRAATAERFETLVERLEQVFCCRCTAEPDEQDASLCGRVVVPASCETAGRRAAARGRAGCALAVEAARLIWSRAATSRARTTVSCAMPSVSSLRLSASVVAPVRAWAQPVSICPRPATAGGAEDSSQTIIAPGAIQPPASAEASARSPNCRCIRRG